MASNPSYFKAFLAQLINANDAAWHFTFVAEHNTLADTARDLAFHGDAYGKSSPDVDFGQLDLF